MLKKLFSSAIRADILSLLYVSSDDKFYVREIAKLLHKNPSGIKRELDNLELAELVVSEQVANLKYFTAHKSSVIFPELKSLLIKALGLEGSLKALASGCTASLAMVIPDPRDAAKATVLFVGGRTDPTSAMQSIADTLRMTLTGITMEEKEYRQKKRARDKELSTLLAQKRITLIGRV